MKLKVCGLNHKENIEAIVLIKPDFVGFIFYGPSKRYVFRNKLTAGFFKKIPETVKKTGVFVDASFQEITEAFHKYKLDYIQLHGNEDKAFCEQLFLKNIPLIKAFQVNDTFNFKELEAYQPFCDFFLFDAKGKLPGGNGIKFFWELLKNYSLQVPFFLSGGIRPDDVEMIQSFHHEKLYGVDINSGFEQEPGIKNVNQIEIFKKQLNKKDMNINVDNNGYYGQFGGAFIPEMLYPNIEELRKKYLKIIQSKSFINDFKSLLRDYVGRPSPLFYAQRLSSHFNTHIYLKREDLNHTGSHKINNTVGQIILAERLGKKRIIAETGAGQHGVATATVCALKNMECIIYMGAEDVRRQAPNVARIKMLGAEVVPVHSGNKTLKDATNEALRDWIFNPVDTHYIIGSVVGPHPYPDMVARFQSVISEEIKKQLKEKTGSANPDYILACVGGGSNAAGAFYHFMDDENVKLYAAEAAGKGIETGEHAASINQGSVGVLHASKSLLLQTDDGQVIEPYSVSAGLDYPGVGPLHAFLHVTGKAKYISITDDEALEAANLTTKLEGIIPALESAHALALLDKIDFKDNETVVVNLSGRGDKDLDTYLKYFKLL